jgi:hypothetical protein
MHAVLRSLGDFGHKLLRIGAGLGVEERNAGSLQLRSGSAIHKREVHMPMEGSWDQNQHGWPWAALDNVLQPSSALVIVAHEIRKEKMRIVGLM